MAMTARVDRDFSGIQVSAADWPMVLIAFPTNQVPDAAIHSVLGKGIHLLEAERVRLPPRLVAYREDGAAADRIGGVG